MSSVTGAMTPLAEALAQILADVAAVAGTEIVPLEAALGRVLAADLMAGIDVPPWDNSAMDGYAVRAADTRPEPAVLGVAQTLGFGVDGFGVDGWKGGQRNP